jgi:hypothetical protein
MLKSVMPCEASPVKRLREGGREGGREGERLEDGREY